MPKMKEKPVTTDEAAKIVLKIWGIIRLNFTTPNRDDMDDAMISLERSMRPKK